MISGPLDNVGGGLALFFSRGVGLATWARLGYLNREVEYYRQLGEALGGVAWVTYGGKEDLELAKSLTGVNVVSNADGLSPAKFARQIGRAMRRGENRPKVLKTNQLSGAYEAFLAHRCSRLPLVVRCGNVRNHWIHYPRGKRKLGHWLKLRTALHAARKLIVPTVEEAQYAKRRFFLPGSKVSVVPNFVPTEVFRFDGRAKQKGLVGFVGSFKPAKNLPALVKAMAGIPGSRLRLIGGGSEEKQIVELAQRLNVNVEIIPYQRHEELPRYLNECEVFCFPSLYEGHPKALIEAMACGLPVVATPVYGVRNMISHGVNGYLCLDTSPQAIREGLQHVLADRSLRDRMAEEARRYVVEHFSLTVVLEKEIQVYRELNIIP